MHEKERSFANVLPLRAENLEIWGLILWSYETMQIPVRRGTSEGEEMPTAVRWAL